MKKICYTSLVIFILLFFVPKYSFCYNDYTIDSYEVDIKVNENNSYDITEYIEADFKAPKHGIFRKIPIKNNIDRVDGTKDFNRAKISNIDVNKEHTVEKKDYLYNIKIGNRYKTLIGKQNYVIKYNYNIGNDKIKNYDEFYYNIIGNEWDTTINNVKFKITMPKEFNKNKVGFSSGSYGNIGSKDIRYNINGNVITGSYYGTLNPREALTIRIELEDGYFIKTKDFTLVLFVIIPIICLVISIFIWFKYGKDDPVVETVEFYPPEGFNSLETAFAYKGKVNSKDITSLLIYLANKGYIKIIDKEEKNIFTSSNSFEIEKLKEYDGNNYAERKFLSGLFENGKTKVTIADLIYKFYKTMRDIEKKVNCKENKNKIFEKGTVLRNTVVILMILVSMLTIVAVPVLEYGIIFEVFHTFIIMLLYLPFYIVIFKMNNCIMKYIYGAFIVLYSYIFLNATPWIIALREDSKFIVGTITGLICIAGMILSLKFMPKRNKYGLQILGKIKGFKHFLETAEKEELESKVMENPSYFYDILPFTYVLGVSEKWINKFEEINLEPPTWYYSTSPFNYNHFGSFIDDTVKSANTSMTTSYSRSSTGGGFSGSSGGGGYSGGGSGGGGRRLLVNNIKNYLVFTK